MRPPDCSQSGRLWLPASTELLTLRRSAFVVAETQAEKTTALSTVGQTAAAKPVD
jgi:hypothetical protein